MTTATYATTQDLARFLNIECTVPDRNTTGAARPKEVLGTGDNSNLLFYTDNAFIIAGSYTFLKGVSESAGSAMAETTHYTLDKDNGTLTLTTAGKTVTGTANIYGSYSFNKLLITDTQMQEALDRAEAEIDQVTFSHWATGTSATPNYVQVTEEKKKGKGMTDRDYFCDHYPIPNVQTQLTADIAIGATTIAVDSTSGFPSTGTIGIDSDKITYTGKTTTSFTGCSGVLAAHLDNAYVYPYVVEISTTDSGSEPTWSILDNNGEYDIDYNTGRVHLYRTDYDLTYYALQYPPKYIPNRFRVTYIYGNSTIPDDIKRLCLMIAAKDIMHMVVRNAHANGLNSFNPETIGVDEQWIRETIDRYRNIKCSNV